MERVNLQNLFTKDYPSVKNFDSGSKLIGPVTLPAKIGSLDKTKLQTYLYAGLKENYLVCIIGNIDHAEDVFVRVSSACVFGFLLNSLLCDCKNQFEEAIEKMVGKDAGILIFGLDQHGKGIGIEAHFLVYAEGQRRQRGLFAEIYEDLGLDLDYRDYQDIPSILEYFSKASNFKKITMLTEAPDKRRFFQNVCDQINLPIEFATFNTDVTAENLSELSEKVAIGYVINNYKVAS